MRNLFNQKATNNITFVIRELLSFLHVSCTLSYINRELKKHPYFPSLSSVISVLRSYSVEALAFQTTVLELQKIPLPFLVKVNGESDTNLLAVVYALKDDTIEYLNPEKRGREVLSFEDFDRKWPSRIVVAIDGERAKDEVNFMVNRRNEILALIRNWTALLFLPLLAIVSIINSISTLESNLLFVALNTFIVLTGTIVCCALIWIGIDKSNPFLQKICTGFRKADCSSVLQSESSKIFGIGWSEIGVAYFGATLLLLLFQPKGDALLFFISILNVLTLPYIFFSVYHQSRIIKQWCPLCLTVLVLLAGQFIVSIWAGWLDYSTLNNDLSFAFIVGNLSLYIGILILAHFFARLMREAAEKRFYEADLARTKYNPDIFNALLSKQKKAQNVPDNLGIILGNSSGKFHVIKVSNPYCPPCAKAHKVLETLLDGSDEVCLQIIFTTGSNPNSDAIFPARHLLSVAGSSDEARTRKALDDWYLSSVKDYNAFVSRYGVPENFSSEDDMINRMNDWCKSTAIEFTPTIFVNGYQLPKNYKVEDIKYILDA